MDVPRRKFLHRGRGRCRVSGNIEYDVGADLSVSFRALDRPLSAGRP